MRRRAFLIQTSTALSGLALAYKLQRSAEEALAATGTYTPTTTTRIFNRKRTDGTSNQQHLSNLIAAAAHDAASPTLANPGYLPVGEVFSLPTGHDSLGNLTYSNVLSGPNARQGVVRIEATSDAPFSGRNRLLFTGSVVGKANVRTEFDAGICIDVGAASGSTGNAAQDGHIFLWDGGIGNVSIVRANPNTGQASGRRRGLFMHDASKVMGSGLQPRLLAVNDVHHWLTDGMCTLQADHQEDTSCCAIVGRTPSPYADPDPNHSPRYFIHRNHINDGDVASGQFSGPGWGCIQLISAYYGVHQNIQTYGGGTALRIETGTQTVSGASGYHFVRATNIYGEECNRVLQLQPAYAQNDHLLFENFYGYGMGNLVVENHQNTGVDTGAFKYTDLRTGAGVAGPNAMDTSAILARINSRNNIQRYGSTNGFRESGIHWSEGSGTNFLTQPPTGGTRDDTITAAYVRALAQGWIDAAAMR